MKYDYDECGKDEIFVGNTRADNDLSELPGVKCRLGTQAYDINGRRLPTDYMLPLYVHKDSMRLYIRIYQQRLDAINKQ